MQKNAKKYPDNGRTAQHWRQAYAVSNAVSRASEHSLYIIKCRRRTILSVLYLNQSRTVRGTTAQQYNRQVWFCDTDWETTIINDAFAEWQVNSIIKNVDVINNKMSRIKPKKEHVEVGMRFLSIRPQQTEFLPNTPVYILVSLTLSRVVISEIPVRTIMRKIDKILWQL